LNRYSTAHSERQNRVAAGHLHEPHARLLHWIGCDYKNPWNSIQKTEVLHPEAEHQAIQESEGHEHDTSSASAA